MENYLYNSVDKRKARIAGTKAIAKATKTWVSEIAIKKLLMYNKN